MLTIKKILLNSKHSTLTRKFSNKLQPSHLKKKNLRPQRQLRLCSRQRKDSSLLQERCQLREWILSRSLHTLRLVKCPITSSLRLNTLILPSMRRLLLRNLIWQLLILKEWELIHTIKMMKTFPTRKLFFMPNQCLISTNWNLRLVWKRRLAWLRLSLSNLPRIWGGMISVRN